MRSNKPSNYYTLGTLKHNTKLQCQPCQNTHLCKYILPILFFALPILHIILSASTFVVMNAYRTHDGSDFLRSAYSGKMVLDSLLFLNHHFVP